MIHAIDLRKLRNPEFLQLMEDICAVISNNDPVALQVEAQYAALLEKTTGISTLFRTEAGSPLSDEVAGLDAARDRLIIGLVKLCDAHTYGPDAAKRTAADVLSRNLALYGAPIAKQSYQAESATISNILTDWDTHPELTAASALIGAGEWVTALGTANEAFKAKYLQRTGDLASATTDTIRDRRDETNAAWYKLRDRIDSFFTINEGGIPWGVTTAQLNALIDQYNTLLTARAARGDHGNGAAPQG